MPPVQPTPASRPYYGWNIVAVTILAQVATSGLTFQSLSLFLHDWSSEMHVKVSFLQLATFGLTVVGAATAPLAGMLADKFPARWVFGCGLLGMAAFFFALSFTTAAWQILA